MKISGGNLCWWWIRGCDYFYFYYCELSVFPPVTCLVSWFVCFTFSSLVLDSVNLPFCGFCCICSTWYKTLVTTACVCSGCFILQQQSYFFKPSLTHWQHIYTHDFGQCFFKKRIKGTKIKCLTLNIDIVDLLEKLIMQITLLNN